jgi:hypothetical protein
MSNETDLAATPSDSAEAGEHVFEELRAYRSGLAPHEIADTLHALVATRRRGLWLICRYLADLASSQGYRALDYPSIHAFAWVELGMTRDQVNRKLRVGRALRTLPLIEEAFVLGDIGFARVREIVRVATPETEAMWLDLACRLSRRDLEDRVARARGVDDAWEEDVGDDPEPQADVPARDGWVRVEMPSELWARLEAAMDLVCQLEGASLDEPDALTLVTDAAMAQLQAQVVLAPARAAANDDGNVGGDCEGDEDGDEGGDQDARPVGRRSGRDANGPQGQRPVVGAMGAACPGRGRPAASEGARPMGREVPGIRGPRGVSETARRVWEVLDHRARAADTLMEAAKLHDAPRVAAAIVELEIAGHAEKVAGGWRRIRRQAA